MAWNITEGQDSGLRCPKCGSGLVIVEKVPTWARAFCGYLWAAECLHANCSHVWTGTTGDPVAEMEDKP